MRRRIEKKEVVERRPHVVLEVTSVCHNLKCYNIPASMVHDAKVFLETGLLPKKPVGRPKKNG